MNNTIDLASNSMLEEMMEQRIYELSTSMQQRRSVRRFSSKPVPPAIIKNCIRIAASAPSGANKQPWHFVIVSDPDIKKQIRIEAEKVEYNFYKNIAPQDWLDALEPLGTNHEKPFLETAPYLIVVFMQKYGVNADGTKEKHYYPLESIGISTGMLLTAIHAAGLSSLVYTPAKMKFLNSLLGRPQNERAFSIIVTGYADSNVEHPAISKKSFRKIATFI